jgi:hypothetical protein
MPVTWLAVKNWHCKSIAMCSNYIQGLTIS